MCFWFLTIIKKIAFRLKILKIEDVYIYLVYKIVVYSELIKLNIKELEYKRFDVVWYKITFSSIKYSIKYLTLSKWNFSIIN